MVRTRVLVSLGALAFAAALLVPAAARANDGLACGNAAERAQQLRAKRKLVEARAELVKCSNAGCPRFVQIDCLRWLDDVSSALPTIVIRGVDKNGSDVLEGTVLVDGDTRGSLGVGIELDPGPHTIVVISETERGEVKLLVAEGERNRVAVVTLGAAPGPEPSEPAARPPGARAPAPHERPDASNGVGPWPFVAFGVGALGFIAMGALQIAAQNQYDDLEKSCGHSCSASDVDSVRTKVIGSAVGLVAGVLGAGAGVLLLMLNRSGPAVTVSPSSSGASADVVVRF